MLLSFTGAAFRPEKDRRFAPLARLVSENRGLWSDKAEACLLEIMKEEAL